MDRREMAITVVGLLATYLLPWPGGPEPVGLEERWCHRGEVQACPVNVPNHTVQAPSRPGFANRSVPIRVSDASARPARSRGP